MNLSDAIYSIEWSFGDRNYEYYVDDVDADGNELTITLLPDIKLFNYFVVINDEEIEIGEVDVQLRYKAKLRFDSIDIIKEEYSFRHSVEFQCAYIFSMSDHENLSFHVCAQIEADIRDGRNIVLDEPTFKVILDALQ